MAAPSRSAKCGLIGLDLSRTIVPKMKKLRGATFAISSHHDQYTMQELIGNLKQAHYIVYVKQQHRCEDLCLFNDKGQFLTSYIELKHMSSKNHIAEDLSQWGNEVFGFADPFRYRHDRQSIADNTQYDIYNKYLVHCKRAYNITQGPQAAAATVTVCGASPDFLIDTFCNYAAHHSRLHIHTGNRTCSKHAKDLGQLNRIDVPVGVVIHLSAPELVQIDLAWDQRIHHLVGKKGVLDDAMSWLNTLGGGYSALGDYFKHHAEKAGKVSMQQLRVAIDMGDPPTVIRCYLYTGLSLMQCGHLRQAKRIIRYQYRLAKQIAASDNRLLSSCHGLWSRLSYLYSLRRQRKEHPSG